MVESPHITNLFHRITFFDEHEHHRNNIMSSLGTFIHACHEVLTHSTSAAAARSYLIEQRGLKESTWRTFKVGYCDASIDIPDLTQPDAEICATPYRYERNIRNKVIVPICDEYGIAVGFATRSPRDDGTTWWNTPFEKSKTLFALNRAKKSIFEQNKVRLVEGYMDVMVPFQEGITNIVSPMGTNLSLRQIALLARYCENVCICFDVDKNNAGQNAQSKSIMVLNNLHLFDDLSIIKGIPEGVDPDRFVLSHGVTKFLDGEYVLTQSDIKKISQGEPIQ